MAVLIYTESEEGQLKKGALEVASYGRALADMLQTTLVALTINTDDVSVLSSYGVDKILTVKDDALNIFVAKFYALIINEACKSEQADTVVLSSSLNSKYLAPLLAVKLQAGYVSNVVELPASVDPFIVKHSVFTNKAFEESRIETDIKIISISANAYGLVEQEKNTSVEAFLFPVSGNEDIQVLSEKSTSNKVTIADADIVVSGGRGLKGPENWGMIEELADVLGAATACSKPVSDLGWRPHSEHVGQTGKPVATNLYIAIGISGAIQHLAGINASKVKVVINIDPEAPFFKAADYGVVGDAFEVVPQLIDKIKQFKNKG